MKTNYTKNEKVKITKPGIFFGCEGEVERNNADTKFKPLLVALAQGNGTWSFDYVDVVALGSSEKLISEMNKAFKNKPVPKAEGVISAPTEHGVKIEEKAKRAYNKVAKPVKQKRKYTRKAKI